MGKPPTRINRVLLKISGESLAAKGHGGLDPAAIESIAGQIAKLPEHGVEIAIVVGGGNFIRGAQIAKMGTHRATADQMGMLATAINVLALQDALERRDVDTRAASAVEMPTFMEPYVRRRADRHLARGRVVLLACGTGNPYFTTDSAAALRAAELSADVLFKATKVDGVYTADPETDPSAKRIAQVTFREALQRDLRIMDHTAFTLCMENNMPIMVFNLFEDGNLQRAVKGESIGSWVVGE
ncbi:MAG: UMP kinase [Planctomycetota bacterium]